MTITRREMCILLPGLLPAAAGPAPVSGAAPSRPSALPILKPFIVLSCIAHLL